MNDCCNGDFGSGKVCTGGAFRTASEAQSGWAPCYGDNGHFGTDTFAPATNTCSNANGAVASWSQTNLLRIGLKGPAADRSPAVLRQELLRSPVEHTSGQVSSEEPAAGRNWRGPGREGKRE